MFGVTLVIRVFVLGALMQTFHNLGGFVFDVFWPMVLVNVGVTWDEDVAKRLEDGVPIVWDDEANRLVNVFLGGWDIDWVPFAPNIRAGVTLTVIVFWVIPPNGKVAYTCEVERLEEDVIFPWSCVTPIVYNFETMLTSKLGGSFVPLCRSLVRYYRGSTATISYTMHATLGSWEATSISS